MQAKGSFLNLIKGENKHEGIHMKSAPLLISLFFSTLFASDTLVDQNSNDNAKLGTKPNVLLIVLDDAAYSDFGCYGGEIDTPNIDALVEKGISFSQFHVTPNCSSTRASLLSGMDHHRTGMGTHAVLTENQKGKPGYEGSLNHRVTTLATAMKTEGYHTIMTGKWHMGSRDPKSWPDARGFDDSFALLNGGASHWQDNLPLFPAKPSTYTRNGEVIKKLPEGFYSTTNYTSEMINFIEANKQKGKPFMGYLAYTAPHNPLHAPADVIAKYKDTYKAGWDALQKSRLAGLKSKGLIKEDVPAQPRPAYIRGWNKLSADEQENAARDMAVYAAMIDVVDQNLGRLFGYLRTSKLYENTMILLISDNGPSKTTIADYLNLDGAGADFIKTFNNSLDNRGLPGSSVDLGAGWAQGLAAPFRMMKGYQAQGGILSPLIVKLPKSMQQADKTVQVPVHVMNIMPTLLDLAGNRSRKPAKGKLEMQGVSLLPVMTGESDTLLQSRGFGGELFGMKFYRKGQWKILNMPVPYGTGNWQLFDLSSDPGEITDVSSMHSKIREQLIAAWLDYAKVNGVIEPDKPVLYAKPPTKSW